MTLEEFNNLKAGDQVRSRSGGGSLPYTVLEVGTGTALIAPTIRKPTEIEIKGRGYVDWKLVKRKGEKR